MYMELCLGNQAADSEIKNLNWIELMYTLMAWLMSTLMAWLMSTLWLDWSLHDGLTSVYMMAWLVSTLMAWLVSTWWLDWCLHDGLTGVNMMAWLVSTLMASLMTVHFLNCYFSLDLMSYLWLKTIIVLLPKGASEDPSVPLSLLSCTHKGYSGILNARMVKYLEDLEWVDNEQRNFRKCRYCQDNIFSLTSIICIFVAYSHKICSHLQSLWIYRKHLTG